MDVKSLKPLVSGENPRMQRRAKSIACMRCDDERDREEAPHVGADKVRRSIDTERAGAAFQDEAFADDVRALAARTSRSGAFRPFAGHDSQPVRLETLGHPLFPNSCS